MRCSLRERPTFLAALVAAIALSTPAVALTINPIFSDPSAIDPSLVSLSGNLAAENAVQVAAQTIASQYSNNITVNIVFYGLDGPSDEYGASSVTGYIPYTYAQYTDALRADALSHPSNLALATAIANLKYGNAAQGDPASTFVWVTTADARALGLGMAADGETTSPEYDAAFNYVGDGGTVDGYINYDVNSPLSYSRPLADGTIDLIGELEHEIDEVLGIGGSGSTLNDYLFGGPDVFQDYFGEPLIGTFYGPLDLYRYSAPGTPSFFVTSVEDPDPLAGDHSVYFSIDGGNTVLEDFNQNLMPEADAGDWGPEGYCSYGALAGSGHVQDSFTCTNTPVDVTKNSPEDFAFQAIGYNRVPEPITLSLFGAGLAGAFALRRRKKSI